MTEQQFKIFSDFRNQLKEQVELWAQNQEELFQLQKAASLKDTPDYPLETSVVYNRALNEISETDEIKLIVVGDNPGKDEQLLINNKYLVGLAGKIGEGFFKKNPELQIDFRKNVIILNKTPVHSAKTNHLKYIEKNGSDKIRQLLVDSQRWMAQKTAALQKELKTPEIWLVGYSELKQKGIFTCYRDELKNQYASDGDFNKVKVFQHFSMNRFSIDLCDFQKKNPDFTLQEAISALGTFHRDEIFI